MIQQKVRKKKTPVLMLMLKESPMHSKQTNKMWSLKSLVMLKCETRTSLYAVHSKRHIGSVLMFYHYFRNG